jgi:glycosyltransferase involved in cell wall biosynthesis
MDVTHRTRPPDEKRLRITCVLSEFPLPRDRGGQLRNLGILEALASHHAVRVLSPRRIDTTDANVQELSDLIDGPVEVFEPRWSDQRTPQGVAARWLLAVLTGRPPWVVTTFTRLFKRRLLALARESDVVLLMEGGAEAWPRALLRRLEPNPVVVLDKHAVATASLATTPEHEQSAIRRLRHRLLVALTRRSERSSLRRADFVIVTSEADAARLATMYGRPADAILRSAVHMRPQVSGTNGSVVGFLGALDYAPNYIGLTRFLGAEWSRLHERGIELLVAGRLNGDAVDPTEGVEILGFIEDQDFDAFLGRLSAAVVPLWDGAGVKLKTLTLMGAGVPTVATPVALEGIPAVHGRHCLIADDPEGLADALERLVSDRDLAGRVGREGRQLVADHFSWGRVGPEYVRVIERASRLVTPAGRRQQVAVAARRWPAAPRRVPNDGS